MPTPRNMTDAINQVLNEDPKLTTRKQARAVVVKRWPVLKSIPHREVMRGPERTAVAAPKGPSPADLVAASQEIERTRQQVAVMDKALTARDEEIAKLKETITRLEGELEEFIIEDEGKAAGKKPAGKKPNPADPLSA